MLNCLEKSYGKPKPPHPTDPYEIILYINCGYPARDASCAKAFDALKRSIGLRVDDILSAPKEKLSEVMRLGGIIPELRALRLKEIAALVKHTFAGDLRTLLKKPLPEAKKALKKFPAIGDPGAEKILLFTTTAPVAAIPSNCVHVPPRLGFGEEKKNYAASYRSVQEAIRTELPEECDALLRAYLLIKQHGQEFCKRSRPRCAVQFAPIACISKECSAAVPGLSKHGTSFTGRPYSVVALLRLPQGIALTLNFWS